MVQFGFVLSALFLLNVESQILASGRMLVSPKLREGGHAVPMLFDN